jgi:hypothetical protein
MELTWCHAESVHINSTGTDKSEVKQDRYGSRFEDHATVHIVF